MESKKSIKDVLKYGVASLAFVGATYLGANVSAPNQVYAEEPAKQEQTVDMKDGKNCHTVEVCEKPKEQPKPAPKKAPKGPKKAPKKQPKDTPCEYNTTLKTVGAKGEEVGLSNIYGPEAACSYRTADINAGQEYILTASGNKYFTAMPILDVPENAEVKRAFYNSKGQIQSIVFKAKGNVVLQSILNDNDAEDLELIVKKAEAKVEPPKKEDFTPVPAPKPVEQPKPTPVVTEESDVEFDFAVEADMGYIQNTQDLSGSQITSAGFRTGVVVIPSLKLNKNVSLGAYGKFGYINYPSIEINGAATEGNAATEHQFGGGLLLNIKGNKDKASHAGDLKVVFGGGYLGTVQQMNYMGYHFEQNQNGGDFMLAVNAPRLIYADKDGTGFGLEGSTNGRILKTNQDGPGGSFDRGSRFDMKGNLAAVYTHANTIRVKAGLGGTSIDSLLVDAGRKNGSHLVLGIGSPDGESLGWEIEGTLPLPYGVDNDEYGAKASLRLGNLQIGAEGKMYTMPTATGNGDTAENQTIYTGAKASYSTDLDMGLMKAVNGLFGGN